MSGNAVIYVKEKCEMWKLLLQFWVEMNFTLGWLFWEARRCNQLSLDAVQSLACD